MNDDTERSKREQSTTEFDRTSEPATIRRFDTSSGTELTAEIVLAIADARGVDPEEIRSPQLYEVLDTSALEDLFFGKDRSGTGEEHEISLEFSYAEFAIRVENSGWIEVYEAKS